MPYVRYNIQPAISVGADDASELLTPISSSRSTVGGASPTNFWALKVECVVTNGTSHTFDSNTAAAYYGPVIVQASDQAVWVTFRTAAQPGSNSKIQVKAGGIILIPEVLASSNVVVIGTTVDTTKVTLYVAGIDS